MFVDHKDSIFSIFPSPVYKGNRDSNLDPAEEKELEADWAVREWRNVH